MFYTFSGSAAPNSTYLEHVHRDLLRKRDAEPKGVLSNAPNLRSFHPRTDQQLIVIFRYLALIRHGTRVTETLLDFIGVRYARFGVGASHYHCMGRVVWWSLQNFHGERS